MVGWRSILDPMNGLGRFAACLILFVLGTTGVARAEQFVGGDAGSAVYIAWAADETGHIQGQVQLVAFDPKNTAQTRATQASFSGNRRGSEVSLAFPILGAFGGSTWTGRVGGRTLTLDILSSDGTPHEFTLVAGSFQDFQRRVALLHERSDAAQVTQSLAGQVRDVARQLQSESNAISSAEAYLRKVFPTPQRPDDDPQTFSSKYAKAWAKMGEDWTLEQQAAQVSPMTCYQKSQVSYIASNVSYDQSQISYLDSTLRYFDNEAQRNIDVALNGPAVVRSLIAVYHRRASAWSRNTGLTVVDPRSLQAEADRAAAYARSVAVPRLKRARGIARDYDAKGADLKERAARFPDTVECSG
jgi:hypothetical protein